jgi:hypothetical protein
VGLRYYYLVESARVDGKPRIVSQEYLGTAEELAVAMRGGGLGLPDRVQHREFGAVAAGWAVLEDLGVAGLIDAATGPRRSDAGTAAGTYLALAALNRLAAPCSRLRFAEWWAGTAAPRFARVPATVLDLLLPKTSSILVGADVWARVDVACDRSQRALVR